MHSDPKLTERLRAIADNGPLKERVMFGGAAFFLNGNMCVGVYHKDLILRIGEDQAGPALQKLHVSPMDITGKPMRGWVKVAPPGCKTRGQLESWVNQASTFVNTLPKKLKSTSPKKKK